MTLQLVLLVLCLSWLLAGCDGDRVRQQEKFKEVNVGIPWRQGMDV
jgi:hypothetical protein